MASKQIQTDQDVVLLAAKLSDSLDFATDAAELKTKLKTVGPTVEKLLMQITECCLFIREYTGNGFASEFCFRSFKVHETESCIQKT